MADGGDLTFRQLEGLWINAGGRRALAPLMAGVATVESSGNPDAHNPSGASGLWQIEVPLHDAEIPGGAGNVDNPEANAKAAVAVSGNTLSGITANWLVDEPAGAAEAIAKQHGGTVPAGTGTGGGNIELDADPVPGILGGMIPGLNIIGNAASQTGAGGALATISNNLESIEHGIEWFFVPSHWLRIICFLIGVPLVGIGIATMTKGAQPIPVSVGPVGTAISGGSIAPAIGIAEVTVGAMLLFVAFHNLQAQGVNDFPGLVSYFQGALQKQATKGGG